MSIASTPFLVLGAGGLGCPVLLGLTCAGARRLMLADRDRVDESNLHRQVLYTRADVGTPKVEAAGYRLRTRIADLRYSGIHADLDALGVAALLDRMEPGTVVLECSDDPTLKFAVNDACVHRGVPLVVGAVLQWRGQAIAIATGSACYRCIYEEPPPPDLTPPCSTAGVMGAAAGAIGHLMAALAIGLATGQNEVAGRMLALDLRSGGVQELHPAPRPDCSACTGAAAIPTIPPERRACARS